MPKSEDDRDKFLADFIGSSQYKELDNEQKNKLYVYVAYFLYHKKRMAEWHLGPKKVEENEKEQQKLKKLKRDQDILEFEKKGGFSNILREIFNPQDEGMELDSVFQIK